MRTKKAFYSTACALLLQFVTILCGFILPRLIIKTFGSQTNGLISSISQFLGYIVLLESGLGGVTRAALYKPLSKKDNNAISSILIATEKFFRKIAIIFLLYSFIIAIFFNRISTNNFDWGFTFTLTLIIGISTFFQYYFGISYSILLQADQKSYISNIIQITTIILNTAISLILISQGANIHIVKLASTGIFILRPILLNCYIKKNYLLNKKLQPNYTAIEQRWAGLGHHIAYFLHTHTDIVVLSIFTNMKEVSVYSVYYMVVSSLKNITTSFANGLEAAFGNIIANDEKNILGNNFKIFELITSSITVILFTVGSLLLSSFMKIYTKGVSDVEYIRPLFGYILVVSEALYCIRIPYNSVALAAGHFKQTQKGAYIETGINIILSVILVKLYGLTGVAFATLLAMLYRTIDYAVYISKNILQRSFWVFIRRQIITVFNAIIIVIIAKMILENITIVNYGDLIIYGAIITLLSFGITVILNLIFYKEELFSLFRIAKRFIRV